MLGITRGGLGSALHCSHDTMTLSTSRHRRLDWPIHDCVLVDLHFDNNSLVDFDGCSSIADGPRICCNSIFKSIKLYGFTYSRQFMYNQWIWYLKTSQNTQTIEQKWRPLRKKWSECWKTRWVHKGGVFIEKLQSIGNLLEIRVHFLPFCSWPVCSRPWRIARNCPKICFIFPVKTVCFQEVLGGPWYLGEVMDEHTVARNIPDIGIGLLGFWKFDSFVFRKRLHIVIPSQCSCLLELNPLATAALALWRRRR